LPPFLNNLGGWKVLKNIALDKSKKTERKDCFWNSNFGVMGNSKGLSPSTTPFGRRKFMRLVGLTIHQVYLLSTQK